MTMIMILTTVMGKEFVNPASIRNRAVASIPETGPFQSWKPYIQILRITDNQANHSSQSMRWPPATLLGTDGPQFGATVPLVGDATEFQSEGLVLVTGDNSQETLLLEFPILGLLLQSGAFGIVFRNAATPESPGCPDFLEGNRCRKLRLLFSNCPLGRLANNFQFV
jgi:hypothetical protein